MNFFKKYYIYLFIIIISLSLFYFSNMSSFHNKYAIVDDAQQSIYWMHGFVDNGLFQNDPLTEYATFFNSQGVGFVAIYYFLMKIFKDPILIFKLLSIFCVVLSSVFIFKIGEKIKNKITGIILTILFLLFLPSMGVSNGFYKNLGMVLFIIFFYFYISKKQIYSYIITILISLIYAPITLVCLFLLAFSMIDKNNKFYITKNKKAFYLFLISSFICLIILSSSTLLSDKSQFGHLTTFDEMKQMPEFYNGGRAPILPISLTSAYTQTILPFLLPELLLFRWPFLYHPENYLLFYAYALIRIIVIITFFIFLINKLKYKVFKLPKEVWLLFFSGLILFLISKLFFFYLYVPKRYISYTLPLFIIIFLTLSIDKFMNIIKEHKKRNLLLTILILFFLIFSFPMSLNSLKGSLDSSSCKENAKVLDFLATLPKEVVLAGYPYDMDCVPIISKRKVYLNFELSHPLYVKYYQLIKNRTYKLFYAYYSKDKEQLEAFCKNEKVDYFVFNKIRFNEEFLNNKEFYTNPFNDFIIKLTDNNNEFYYNKIKNEDIIFEDNNFVVIKC